MRWKQVLHNVTGQIRSLDCKGQCAVVLPPSSLPMDLGQNNELLLGLGALPTGFACQRSGIHRHCMVRVVPNVATGPRTSRHRRSMRQWQTALHDDTIAASGWLLHSSDPALWAGRR